ncbi:PREDICTED: uncharacterized protein LOC104610231 [Nelumbo nucifera]|uniref:Uncharacterized protein LOC104610231 n=1 Tax=Nelumbo nucifera TaxID=4432 RepID=A0A1U8B2P6_NELNU|nr:PREDICTED: uncharacterized protein LOC104610231 [Nelumbo nucifera]
MDESWRMQMGFNVSRRRSTEESLSDRLGRSYSGLGSSHSDTINPEEFNDVYGGPPRTIFSRQFSGSFSNRLDSFYVEIFQPSDLSAPANGGRNLPVFRIPASRCGSGRINGVYRQGDGFYNDIFGPDEDRRSRPRSKSKPNSKSNSSTVLSPEDLSPLRPSIAEDIVFSSFTSKLRPINVRCQQNSPSRMYEEQQRKHAGASATPSTHLSYTDFQYTEQDYTEPLKSSHVGFSRRNSSPETIISVEPNSYQSIKISVDDVETDSPSSEVSSLYGDAYAEARMQGKALQDEEVEQEEDEEIMSSYVIEINSDKREGSNDSLAIDEAIAWAKEKYFSQSYEDSEGGNRQKNIRQKEKEPSVERGRRSNSHESMDQQTMEGHGRMQTQSLVGKGDPSKWTTAEENQQLQKDMEMEQLEEEVRLWAAGKEGNIRLLLSTLHHILWPNSGWQAIPLIELIEASQVKKAYQKVRLCLHPDKLQQRGITFPQKYVAEKAFTILQDSWTAFISQDVLFG